MKKVWLIAIVAILITVSGVIFFIYTRNSRLNSKSFGPIASLTPENNSIKELIEKYPLDTARKNGLQLSTSNSSQVWIIANVASIDQDFTSQTGVIAVDIRGDKLQVNINEQTRFTKKKAGATSIEDSGYEVIRIDGIRIGDAVIINAGYSNQNLLAVDVQKQF